MFETLAARRQTIAPNEVVFATRKLRHSVTAVLQRCASRLSSEDLIRLQSSLHAALDEQSEIAIKKIFDRRIEALTDQAERDPLTKLPNRAAFTRRLEQEVARARRYERELALSLFDVDNFKSVNDRFGHPAGDQVLTGVANILRASLRTSDAVFRYGGDEFIALCPETSRPAIEHILRRMERHLRAYCAGNRWAHGAGISWGHACFPTDAASAAELIIVADQRLYACKKEHHLQMAARP